MLFIVYVTAIICIIYAFLTGFLDKNFCYGMVWLRKALWIFIDTLLVFINFTKCFIMKFLFILIKYADYIYPFYYSLLGPSYTPCYIIFLHP